MGQLRFVDDTNAFAIISTGSGFEYNFIAWKCLESICADVFRVAENIGGGWNVVLGKELFLNAFVLNGFQNGGFGDHCFSFFFKGDECIHVDVFNFPGNHIGLGCELSDVVIALEASFDHILCDGAGGTIF